MKIDRGWLQSGQSAVKEVQGGPCNAMRVDHLGRVCERWGWDGRAASGCKVSAYTTPYPKEAGQERKCLVYDWLDYWKGSGLDEDWMSGRSVVV